MKSKFIIVSNILLFVAASLLVATGLVLEFKIGEKAGATHLGFDREQWGEFHFFTAISVIVATFVHLAANIWWLRQVYTKWRFYTIMIIVAGLLPTLLFLSL
jgi:hypothetical protein